MIYILRKLSFNISDRIGLFRDHAKDTISLFPLAIALDLWFISIYCSFEAPSAT